MKKLLAVIMSVVMAFSIAVVPASAAAEDVTLDDVFTAIDTSIALIEDTIAQIHNIVGSILAVLGKECPMCAEIHEIPEEEGTTEDVVIPEVSDEAVVA